MTAVERTNNAGPNSFARGVEQTILRFISRGIVDVRVVGEALSGACDPNVPALGYCLERQCAGDV